MRKTLVIIFAVAILGGLSFYVNNSKASMTSQTTTSGVNSGSGAASGSRAFKDGTYSGNASETPYGTVQVEAIITGGKITDVKFLQMPFEERRSQEITSMSEPALKQNTLSAQSSKIDFVTGATSTSYGYQESLQAALNKAKLS
jgi:uncharacterized protein with FMN-binding domain